MELFREVQRFRQWWLLATAALTALIGWSAFIEQIVIGEAVGTREASDATVLVLWAFTGVLLPAVVLLLRLETVVVPGGVEVRFAPFPGRRIATTEILDVQPVSVRPMVEWGGYGYRRNLRGHVAYLVQGRSAVRLALGDEKVVVIGSTRPEQLAAAISEAGRFGG